MKFFCLAALGAALSLVITGCAGQRAPSLGECSPMLASVRGRDDGAAGRNREASFLHACRPESRPGARAAYRDAWETARAEREVESEDGDASPILATPARSPAAASWVCEVEANAKIFTGVGESREEALVSARSTCGSHFRAAYCGQADCKQNI